MEGEVEEVTAHQFEVLNIAAKGGDYCPQCKSNGGQYMSVENPGEDWTQVHCAYGCGYYNLDDYYKPLKKIK